jgi:Protein of unknown function (DUF3631)
VNAAIDERRLFNTREEIVAAVPEPKASSPALGALLQAICDYLVRFMAFSSESQPVAVALWIAHTWTIDAFDYTPYLHILSPEKRCGKSRLLDCIGLLAAKPWRVVSPSEAVLFRKIEADAPTLLLDEADTIFCNGKDDGKEPLRALLNAGFERLAKIPRCVGPNNELREFAVFSAKALAGIGKLPDTVSDRCIPIRLVRRAQNEGVERFRRREADAIASTTRDALAQWSGLEHTRATLRDARPDIPDQLGDRQTDICEPLLAVADLAGDGWPERARNALTKLCTGEIEEDESLGVKLLRTIRTIFEASSADKIASRELLDALVSTDDDGPWAAWWERDLADNNTRGPAAKLARLLKPYDIRARGIRLDDGATPKGYREEDFQEAWKRYCPPKTP